MTTEFLLTSTPLLYQHRQIGADARNAYLRGIEIAVIENTGAVYLLVRYEMIREFVR